MIDADVIVFGDVCAAASEVARFPPGALFGFVPELSWGYTPLLGNGIDAMTIPAGPPSLGQVCHGVNSGVVLVNHTRAQQVEWNSWWPTELVRLAAQRHLRELHQDDQDVYNLFANEYPDLVHVLPIGWNMQLADLKHCALRKWVVLNQGVMIWHGNGGKWWHDMQPMIALFDEQNTTEAHCRARLDTREWLVEWAKGLLE